MARQEQSEGRRTGEPPRRRRGRPPTGGREAILRAALQLLRDRGVAKLTTREIASLAGVSEASIFYHYHDRAGLLTAVLEAGMRRLEPVRGERLQGDDHRVVLTRAGKLLEGFLDEALPVMAAAQSDFELRDAMLEWMSREQLGPHRAVKAVGDYLGGEQAAGRLRADVDPYAVALLFVGACHARAAARAMPMAEGELPPLEAWVDALDAMLAPVGGVGESPG